MKNPRRKKLSKRAEVVLRQRHIDLAWVSSHEAVLQRKYRGQAIAVLRDKVVAHARSRYKLERKLAKKKFSKRDRETVLVLDIIDDLVEFPPDCI